MIPKYFNNIINPQWLQRIDRNLLLNRPKLWSLKLPCVCYYALLANVLIALIVFYFIPIYDLPNYELLGYVIHLIGVVLVCYWWYRQSLFNVEKRYSNTHKSNGCLEILGYSVCIILIFSVSLVFYLSMELNLLISIHKTELSIDLLMLDTIEIHNLAQQNNENDDYFKALRVYINSSGFKEQQKKSIFFDKFDNSIFFDKFDNSQQTTTELQKCLKDKNLQVFFKDSIKINIENFTFLEDNIDSDKYKQCEVFNYLLNKKASKLLKISCLAKLVESIRNNELKECLRIEEYAKVDTSNVITYELLSKALSNATKIYQKFYHSSYDYLRNFALYFYLCLNVFSLIVFLLNNTYLVDFILAIIYLAIFYIVAFVFVLWLTFSLYSSSVDKLNSRWMMIIFIILPTMFISYQAIDSRNLKKYSRFKVLNLVAFPFAVVVSTSAILIPRFNTNDNNIIGVIIVSLSYLPFVHWLKVELTRQLSLPKD